MGRTVDTEGTSTAEPESDARRGERQGRAYARLGIDIPPLVGGAYAVGFLYGYKAEQRLREMPARRHGAA